MDTNMSNLIPEEIFIKNWNFNEKIFNFYDPAAL